MECLDPLNTLYKRGSRPRHPRRIGADRSTTPSARSVPGLNPTALLADLEQLETQVPQQILIDEIAEEQVPLFVRFASVAPPDRLVHRWKPATLSRRRPSHPTSQARSGLVFTLSLYPNRDSFFVRWAADLTHVMSLTTVLFSGWATLGRFAKVPYGIESNRSLCTRETLGQHGDTSSWMMDRDHGRAQPARASINFRSTGSAGRRTPRRGGKLSGTLGR